ncbi:MAG: hypothetical protein EHM85_03590 [Desulfobacteraceae bacterium]|nr:MAG: hypothetical protein EHM85_03590 [Desulfobacteraceae bacterium]
MPGKASVDEDGTLYHIIGDAYGVNNQAIGHRCYSLACAFGTRKLRSTGQRRIIRGIGRARLFKDDTG